MTFHDGEFTVNTQLVNTLGVRRYKKDGKGYYFSKKLLEWLGPMRDGDEIDDPYIDYAASIQDLLEKTALHLIDYYLGDIIKETGKVCFAGGVALNVKLNQRIIAMPGIKELFVQPAASDAGTAIGAASYASEMAGVPVEKMEHVYLGPSYTTEECIAACEAYPQEVSWQKLDNVCQQTAEILNDGQPRLMVPRAYGIWSPCFR